MIKILIVDDSNVEIAILTHLFESEPDLQVIGVAKNGKDALRLANELKPDIITMDINMPIMDGLGAIQALMADSPIPIVVISSVVQDEELNMTFKALEAGALSVLDKPANLASPAFKSQQQNIIRTIRAMSEIKVIKRRFNKPKISHSIQPVTHTEDFEILAIGTSVGGPQVLKYILSQLPVDFPLPIVVVQHMTPGFMDGFVKWLNDNIALTVKIVENGELLTKGKVYFAPDNTHLEVGRFSDGLIARLIKAPPVSGFCPSATVLLSSVSRACQHKGIGMLLTGMGNDGAEGLLDIKKANGHTLIQDKESAVVFGMAGVAESLGAVDKIVELEKIPEYLKQLTKSDH